MVTAFDKFQQWNPHNTGQSPLKNGSRGGPVEQIPSTKCRLECPCCTTCVAVLRNFIRVYSTLFAIFVLFV